MGVGVVRGPVHMVLRGPGAYGSPWIGGQCFRVTVLFVPAVNLPIRTEWVLLLFDQVGRFPLNDSAQGSALITIS